MPTRIGLVAQPKQRRGGICRARDQFDPSPIFRRGRDFCSREHGEWYVVSTAYGLVSPDQVIGANAPPLHVMSAQERAKWAERVAGQLSARMERSAQPLTFVLYASKQYAELLTRAAPFATFELPLAGMSLRERIRWYDERLQIRARVLARPLAG